MSNEYREAQATADKALSTVKAEIRELTDWLIVDDDDYAFATDMLKDVKARTKALEAERKKISVPMNAALKALNALFKAPREAFENAESLLKSKIAEHHEAIARTNAEAFELAASAETATDASAALALVDAAPEAQGVSLRYVWKPTVCNEELLDRRFLVPDMVAIKAWAKANVDDTGEPRPIPGVIFKREAIVAARSQ